MTKTVFKRLTAALICMVMLMTGVTVFSHAEDVEVTPPELKVIFNHNFDTAEGTATTARTTFNFSVQFYNGEEWVASTTKKALNYNAGQAGEKTANTTTPFRNVTFTEAGTYMFRIIEEKGTTAGINYDRREYPFTVEVTDNNGTLEAKVYDHNGNEITTGEYTVEFESTYKKAVAGINIESILSSVAGTDGLSNSGFEFTVTEVDAQGQAVAGAVPETLFTDFSGTAYFTKSFDTAGTYYYHVKEQSVVDANWTYSQAEYTVTVNVAESAGVPVATLTVVASGNDEENGEIPAAADNLAILYFINKYEPSSAIFSFDGIVNATVEGRVALESDLFSFVVREKETQDQVTTGTSDLTGAVTFADTLEFEEVGEYKYEIVQIAGEDENLTYDETVYTLVVNVAIDEQTGKLKAVHSIEGTEDSTVTFVNNYYAAPAFVVFGAEVDLAGRDVEDSEFVFSLYETDENFEIPEGVRPQAAINDEDGKVSFISETFDAAGEYYFTIKQNVENDETVVYDETAHNFKVEVTDDLSGSLFAKVICVATGEEVSSTVEDTTVNAPVVSFTNALLTEAVKKTVLISNAEADGKYVETGKELSYFITYKNYTGKDADVVITDTIPEGTTLVEGSATEGAVIDGDSISWNASANAGATIQVGFRVTADVNNSIIHSNATVSDGTYAYETNEVTNHTVANPLITEIYAEGDLTANIDGKKVNAGDVLVYKISYINVTLKNTKVVITDKIPENATLISGSVTHDGVIKADTIKWTFENVKPWETVTAFYKVQVDKNAGAVKVKNQAEGSDVNGKLKSNEAVTYTVIDDVVMDVVLSSTPTESAVGKEVKAGDTLVYTIKYTNTANEDITAVITNKLPKGVTFVPNSATEGGVYENGEISWNVSIPAKTTVAVSFSVVVNATDTGFVLSNTATALDGDNLYVTNTVKNTVVVVAPAPTPDPTPTPTPGTGPAPTPEQTPVEIVDTTKVFTDVKAGKWYTDAVNYAYSHKFIAGITATEFGRDKDVTRGMFITILARIAGVNTTGDANKVETKFTDVKSGKYYTAAIKWASDNGVVNGLDDTTFGPEVAIERQQLCTMIVNFAKYMKVELTASQTEVAFADADSIRDYAKEAVSTAQKAGIVSGYTENGSTTFKPTNTATRAEAAQILYVFHKNFIAK